MSCQFNSQTACFINSTYLASFTKSILLFWVVLMVLPQKLNAQQSSSGVTNRNHRFSFGLGVMFPFLSQNPDRQDVLTYYYFGDFKYSYRFRKLQLGVGCSMDIYRPAVFPAFIALSAHLWDRKLNIQSYGRIGYQLLGLKNKGGFYEVGLSFGWKGKNDKLRQFQVGFKQTYLKHNSYVTQRLSRSTHHVKSQIEEIFMLMVLRWTYEVGKKKLH